MQDDADQEEALPAKIMQSTFRNELGNSITVKTAHVRSGGGTSVDFESLNISLEGPTSISEWTITIDEAREVHRQLGHWIAISTHDCLL